MVSPLAGRIREIFPMARLVVENGEKRRVSFNVVGDGKTVPTISYRELESLVVALGTTVITISVGGNNGNTTVSELTVVAEKVDFP